ncbi:hypothetical protein CALCODRAFT_505070 [Calocera cornea HHB12733]|uniref:Uncharacterized protein n=1 Tax=Calocera cornea HHB12733 TaxID=1353952 RepID=A0A165C121_9BASI|nr:hypothetical protein CALCODRAFT_505070 [Calocera cornea HHB12733]
MPTATDETGYRDAPRDDEGFDEQWAEQYGLPMTKPNYKWKPDAPRPNFTGKKHLTLYDRVANDTVQRFADEPTFLQRHSNLLPAHRYSVEQYAALQIEDPARLIAKATEDELKKHWHDFQLCFNISYVGKGKIEESDVPFNRAENIRNLWARNPLDPTVYPQPYDSRSPHRAYCPGPPSDPTNAMVWWAPLRLAWWSPFIAGRFRQPTDELGFMHVGNAEHDRLSKLLDKICQGTLGFINAWWVKTLCDAHDDYSGRIRKLLAALPGEHPVRKLYDNFTERWAGNFTEEKTDLFHALPTGMPGSIGCGLRRRCASSLACTACCTCTRAGSPSTSRTCPRFATSSASSARRALSTTPVSRGRLSFGTACQSSAPFRPSSLPTIPWQLLRGTTRTSLWTG